MKSRSTLPTQLVRVMNVRVVNLNENLKQDLILFLAFLGFWNLYD